MTARLPRTRRLFVTGALLLGLTGLIAAGSSMMTVHLFADFDVHDEAGAIVAEVGTFEQITGGPAFEVVFASPDEGVLRIGENPSGVAARLRAELASKVQSAAAVASFRLTPVSNFGSFEVSFAEDGESGMIDIMFDPNGRVRVGDQIRDLPGMPGDEFEVYVEFVDQIWGKTRYEVRIYGEQGTVTLKGDVQHGNVDDLAMIDFVRPGDSDDDGVWELDDLLVTSSVPKLFKLFGGALNLSQ